AGVAMSDATNMSKPVTRGELRMELEKLPTKAKLATKDELKKLATKDELKKLATKDELKKHATKDELKKLATNDELQAAVAKLATKDELQAAVAKLATKDELQAAVAKLATKADLERFPTKEETKLWIETWGLALLARMDEREERLMQELARLARAQHEENIKLLAVFDDKYKDLPGRVTRLETTVFPDEQR